MVAFGLLREDSSFFRGGNDDGRGWLVILHLPPLVLFERDGDSIHLRFLIFFDFKSHIIDC